MCTLYVRFLTLSCRGLEADGTPSVNLRDKLLWNGKGAGWMAGRYSSAGMRAVSRPNIIVFAGILSLAFPEISQLPCIRRKETHPPCQNKRGFSNCKPYQVTEIRFVMAVLAMSHLEPSSPPSLSLLGCNAPGKP